MVRLSSSAVAANANQIVQALGLTPAERAPTTLPLSYSYGLSVLNSHLTAGASVILTAEGLMSRQLWKDLAEYGATSFAGVPASYDMLRRLDLESVFPSSLTTLTQAGGAMAPAMVTRMQDFITKRGGRLFIMYGQTEACARMAVLPPHDLPRCLGAAGLALAGGRFSVEEGSIHYGGPNVMMGYGQCRADLALGDQMGGKLDTGDLGRLDDDGVLWITGRVNRLAKLGGLRLNLDEVESLAARFGPAAVTDGGEVLVVTLAAALPDGEQRRSFAQSLNLHSSQIRWRAVEALPLTANGKIDHGALV
jgi:acyl-coenzyme A synthetase/AMP-(fatty) acid ligase